MKWPFLLLPNTKLKLHYCTIRLHHQIISTDIIFEFLKRSSLGFSKSTSTFNLHRSFGETVIQLPFLGSLLFSSSLNPSLIADFFKRIFPLMVCHCTNFLLYFCFTQWSNLVGRGVKFSEIKVSLKALFSFVFIKIVSIKINRTQEYYKCASFRVYHIVRDYRA